METFRIDAPFGPLNVSCDAAAVTSVHFLPTQEAGPPQSIFARQVAGELQAYFDNPAFVFTLPLRLAGTEFQQRLWQALRAIPVGQVRRYGELSHALNSSARAIGGACRHNPIPLIVPCHRVVSANGDGGFAGATDGPLLIIKRWLLQHEGAERESDGVGQTGDLFSLDRC
ncbi:methylated-DNA--[protein]-cysteine S-methyltransferase [Permianibacter sp. IMCC34836]|uniref:methylated-DNA--[protein]-cysteine S-methyltransferase n=1 Tax=Permianibacter fluminis TaxID=2738515 RepID=UPI00155179A2|nr:methylated-DNA--[protein]-cysteine S-methyltransferase [Permianibacter fluminis]NQD37337.1 methylated-DNA--[protein]-cysteine S-methyltransferase [Permianibacter fluminis]